VPRLARIPAPACPQWGKGHAQSPGACHPPCGDTGAGTNAAAAAQTAAARARITAVRVTQLQRREESASRYARPDPVRGRGRYPRADRRHRLAYDEPRSPQAGRIRPCGRVTLTMRTPPASGVTRRCCVRRLHPGGAAATADRALARRWREDEKVAVASEPRVHLGIWRYSGRSQSLPRTLRCVRPRAPSSAASVKPVAACRVDAATHTADPLVHRRWPRRVRR